MSTITLPNIRVSSDLTVKVRLTDDGVAIDWTTLSRVRATIYSDAQRALAGRCDVSVDAENPTLLVCQYAATKPQYVGVNRIVVSATYMGEMKTYDKPAFTFVRWTADQEGEEITIDDPDVDVEITVEDISSSILQEAVDAAFTAADRANDAAAAAEHMVDIHTGPQGKSAYEVAVEEGYVGTEEEWLASLVGPQGQQGIQGETGDAAGFGAVTASVDSTTGTPSVAVTASGPDTAKAFDFAFSGLKGEKGDKGDQGNTGSSVDYPYELVNNRTTDDATKGLSAAEGKRLGDDLSQLEAEVTDLDERVFGENTVLLEDVTTAPGTVYITSDMVEVGDVLVFELESINNLTGILRAEKTGYEFDANIYVDAGQTATKQYTVPEGFLRIYTQSIANPMKVVSCRIYKEGAIAGLQKSVETMESEMSAIPTTYVAKTAVLQDTGSGNDKVMSQDASSRYVDSPFANVVNVALKGIVAFRFNNVPGGTMPVDDYSQFRVTTYYRGGAWHLYLQIQKSVDGTNWTAYDSIEILSADAPSPLPVIEEITSKYGRFTVIVNWPLMGNATLSGLSYVLRKNAPGYFDRKLKESIDGIVSEWPIAGDYENKDRTKNIITVDASGNGDYTTIASAYAAITDSSYDNQYEIVIYPGTYNEYNLIPPKFTHTHGLIPNTVTVTSEGVSSTLPVFDQRVPCKLSNMKIVSGTGYCVHQDQSPLIRTVLVNENLHCKKVYGQDVSNFGFRTLTNPAVLGIGSHFYGAKFIWNNCTFENGQVASHTVGGSENIPANQHLIYKNCKLVNAYIHLLVSGASSKVGNFVCEIDGLNTEKGRPSLVCQIGERSEGDTSYNFPWQVIGGNNKYFCYVTINGADTLTDDVWPSINTNDVTMVQLASGVSISKGQWVDIAGDICTPSTPIENIIGMAVEDGASGSTVRVCTESFALNNNFHRNAFPVVSSDGEYGIGSDGKLSASASIKIGRVKYNNFYRY